MLEKCLESMLHSQLELNNVTRFIFLLYGFSLNSSFIDWSYYKITRNKFLYNFKFCLLFLVAILEKKLCDLDMLHLSYFVEFLIFDFISLVQLCSIPEISLSNDRNLRVEGKIGKVRKIIEF